MNVYAESSAVPAWLLGEVTGRRVREVFRRADLVVTSDLVLIECDRVLIRAVTLGEIDEATAADRRALLTEPVGTLDAIHLASALAVRSTAPNLELLSLDDRIRRAGKQLGFHSSTELTAHIQAASRMLKHQPQQYEQHPDQPPPTKDGLLSASVRPL